PTVHGLAPSNASLTKPANVPFTWGAVMMIVKSRGVVCCKRYQSTPHEPHNGTRLSRGNTSKASAGLRNSTDANAVPGNGRGPSRAIVAAAAARIVVVPDLMPTMWPFGTTVATAELPLDQTKLTFVISTESPVPTSCQARAVASVSLPRIRIGNGVTLTCTSASCSVG